MGAEAQLTEGITVEGRYVLQSRLGEGTFGSVWRARDTRLSGREVAIKVLKQEFLEHPGAVDRFDAEADALAQLSHPNIVAVLDRGAWEGKRYIVTEFVAGQTLSAWIESHKQSSAAPELRVAAALFEQVCAAVEAAHRVRSPGALVHRDIKPENVIIKVNNDGERVAKLIDFGIAQLGRRNRTASGVTLGTPLYMAPEQAYGFTEGVGPWTDVFALGVVLGEMLTLHAQPTESEPWWAVSIRDTDPVPIFTKWRPDVPAVVWAVVARCLKREGSDRYADAAALRDAFRGALRSVGVAVGSVSDPGFAPTLQAMPVPEGVKSDTRRAVKTPTTALDGTPDDVARSVVAHAATLPGEASALAAEAPLPWGRIVLGVTLGAVLLAGAIVVALVMSDRARRAAPTAGQSNLTAGGVSVHASASPGHAPVSSDARLLTFLSHWKTALALSPGHDPFESLYAASVRWNGRSELMGPAGIHDETQRFAASGGTLAIDLGLSEWGTEAVEGGDVPDVCRQVAGATGAVVKVRAWAVEYRPDRTAAIGCPRLTGRYLLRLRQTAAGFRVCHETWSLDDGICTSCPTALVCRGRGR